MTQEPSGALGRFIREQRQQAHLSLRQMAGMASISNAYLSQIERGLHAPSVRVLRALAGVLEVPVEDLVSRGDPSRADAERPDAVSVEAAIRRDRRLGSAQKDALLAVYRSYVAEYKHHGIGASEDEE
jgi:transcriptional regulator with XRE-family HTH domain